VAAVHGEVVTVATAVSGRHHRARRSVPVWQRPGWFRFWEWMDNASEAAGSVLAIAGLAAGCLLLATAVVSVVRWLLPDMLAVLVVAGLGVWLALWVVERLRRAGRTVPILAFWVGITAEDWDVHWHRIYTDACADGVPDYAAGELADRETAEQFGIRPSSKDGAR
jgi:hypothetical protein